jgi:hypothetical protein
MFLTTLLYSKENTGQTFPFFPQKRKPFRNAEKFLARYL